jgi:hypothetical protein
MHVMSDGINALREAGAQIDQLPEAQRQVFADLSPDEVAVLVSVQERINAVAPEVVGQSTAPGTGNNNNNVC